MTHVYHCRTVHIKEFVLKNLCWTNEEAVASSGIAWVSVPAGEVGGHSPASRASGPTSASLLTNSHEHHCKFTRSGSIRSSVCVAPSCLSAQDSSAGNAKAGWQLVSGGSCSAA